MLGNIIMEGKSKSRSWTAVISQLPTVMESDTGGPPSVGILPICRAGARCQYGRKSARRDRAFHVRVDRAVVPPRSGRVEGDGVGFAFVQRSRFPRAVAGGCVVRGGVGVRPGDCSAGRD